MGGVHGPRLLDADERTPSIPKTMAEAGRAIEPYARQDGACHPPTALRGLDAADHGPSGGKSLQAALDRVDVVICGHIHKRRGKGQDGAWVINPGYAAEGQAAVIDLETMDIVWIDSVI
jgi:hypothetical protein